MFRSATRPSARCRSSPTADPGELPRVRPGDAAAVRCAPRAGRSAGGGVRQHAARVAAPGVSVQQAFGSVRLRPDGVRARLQAGRAASHRPVLAMFLHGGFMHLFGTCCSSGSTRQRRVPARRWRYLLWYLLTGVAATLFFSCSRRVDGADVGASAPSRACSASTSGGSPQRRPCPPPLLPLPRPHRPDPARIVLGMYLFIDNVLPCSSREFGGGWRTARTSAAHRGCRRRVVHGRAGGEGGPAGVKAAPKEVRCRGHAAERLRRGDMPAAAKAYFAMTPHDTRACSTRTVDRARRVARGQGHAKAALTVFQRHLKSFRAARASRGARGRRPRAAATARSATSPISTS